MSKQSALMAMADRIARNIVAEQTRARLMMGFDAALIAANRSFNLGPTRAAKFANDYNEAMEELASMYINDAEENKDKQIEFAKGKGMRSLKRSWERKTFSLLTRPTARPTSTSFAACE